MVGVMGCVKCGVTYDGEHACEEKQLKARVDALEMEVEELREAIRVLHEQPCDCAFCATA